MAILRSLIRATPKTLTPATRLAPSVSVRHASTGHHEEDAGQDQFYTHESFNTPFFVYTGAAVAGIFALYQYSLYSAPAFVHAPSDDALPGSNEMMEEAEDDRRPWLTRYLAYHLAPRSQLDKERNYASWDAVFEAAENRLLVNTAQAPIMRRSRQWSALDDGSPFNHQPGRQVDMSDLVIKTYEDDRKLPEQSKEE